MNKQVYVFIYYIVDDIKYLLTPCANRLEAMEYYKHHVNYTLQDNLILGSAFLTKSEVTYANNLLDECKNKEALESISRISKIKDAF